MTTLEIARPVVHLPAWREGSPGAGLAVYRQPRYQRTQASRSCGCAHPQLSTRPCIRAQSAAVLSRGWASPLTNTAHDREIASIALPALCGMILEPIVSVVNSALVGQLGTVQLGAVSVGSLAISFCTFLFSFLLFLTTPEITAALSNKDTDKVSKITARALYVAASFGLITTVVVALGADAIVAYLQPPEKAVAVGAAQFIRVRALGMVPALLGYVAIGVIRGHKDTRTPLFSAMLSACCSLTLNCIFLYVLEWGTFGCALATTLASVASCSLLCGRLLYKGMLRLSDLRTPPTWDAVLPMLRAGLPLSLRNAISFGMVMFASLLCVRSGSVYQAAFEVIRQVWILTIQSFECVNVATQVLCSAYLGAGNVSQARSILVRLVTIGTVIGTVMGVVVFLSRDLLARFFTTDVAVVVQVGLTLPMVAAFLPLDAVASIMDGSLMAAKQTNFLSATQIAGAGVQYVALITLASNNLISTLSVWSCLKLLTLFRVLGGITRNFASPLSAYKPQPVAAKEAEASTSAEATPCALPRPGTGGRWALDSMDADSVPCEPGSEMPLASGPGPPPMQPRVPGMPEPRQGLCGGATGSSEEADALQALQMQEAGLEVVDAADEQAQPLPVRTA